ncbi:MAG: hypothetical protein E6356_16905 [Terrisporobacter othiniensis]|nr:hypothetical protein [Terrisporobacter othiniensis]
MSKEIDIDELLEGTDDLENLEGMEHLMKSYDTRRVSSKKMNSKEMIMYQDMNYNGKYDEWN